MKYQLIAICLAFGLVSGAGHVAAALPSTPAEKARIVGTPAALEIDPQTISIGEPRASQQILVTARYQDDSVRDITCFCDWSVADPSLLELKPHGLVSGLADGTTHVEIRAAGLKIRVPVTIRNTGQRRPVSFRREVMPVLSAAGCSDIRCHGAPSGKDGFRLSLWGFDPSLDYQQLTRDVWSRRTNSVDPDNGLIMLKATAQVPHVGQRRFTPNSPFARLIREWQTEGLRDDLESTGLRSLTVVPARRVFHAPIRWQQLAVRATFDDGRSVDVTRLTTFSSTDLAVAAVDRTGLVEFHRQGEVAILCRFMNQMSSVRLMHIAAPPSDFRWPNPPENNYVDQHVFAKLKLLNIAPSEMCSDEQFVRRVSLDVCGILPTADETQVFVASTAADKRAKLIDALLERPEYADYWTHKWMDVLRSTRNSIQLVGAQAFQSWMRGKIENDAPLADVVQALITSTGESYKAPAANFYCVAPTPTKVTDPYYLQKNLAESTAQLFLGIRLQCAQCHNHPYERWTQADYLALSAFFTQIKRSRLGKAGPKGRPERRQIAIALDSKAAEIKDPLTGQPVAPALLGGPPLNVASDQDRRKQLADWLTQRDNPFFARASVNRIWFHLHGRGIVEPVDDIRDSNPSANDALLDALARDFVAGGFKVKPLIRVILNSRTYQLSAQPNASNKRDTRYFSHMLTRPLPAEVLLDAICHVTGVPEKFEILKDVTAGIPTELLKYPAGTRAVQLPVSDMVTLINSSGKYVRYETHPFMHVFGQPNRTETCECAREQNFNRKQALELIVGQLVTTKLTQPDNRLATLLASKRPDAEILDELYQLALSRAPAKSAAEAFLKYVAASKEKRQAWEDVLWTVLNSQEFVYQH